MVQQVVQLDVYARVSRAGDDRQRSTTGQVEEGTIQLEDRGYRVGEVHVDAGRSAWNPRVRRPGWDRVMHRLETGATGGVWVFDLARFSRRPIEGERLIEAAEQGLIVLDSEDAYDLTTPNGRKAFRSQLNNAAYESDRLSTRVRRGKRLKARRGETNASGRSFGRELDMTLRESEAAILRDLADRVLADESQDALVIELNRRGIKTAMGKLWHRASLRQVLLRPSNAGWIEYNGELVSRTPEDLWILSEEVWTALCAKFAARRRGRPRSDAYLCSGLMRCGLCGHTLSGRPRKNMKPYADGGVRRQYWCQPRAQDGGCGRIAADQREVDRHVGELVVSVLADPRHAAAVEAAARAVRDRVEELDTAIADCESLAEELAGRLGRGEISLARHDAAVGPLDKRLTQLRAEREGLDAAPAREASPADVAASRSEWRERWTAATVPERRRLIRQALRGRLLMLGPADPTAPRRFDPARIILLDGPAPATGTA